ncbi:O-antigen ligase family protein [bacterium]|nr:O-antigen ligase family protein [bacterium]
MSTNNTPSKLSSMILFISGAYLFFITVVLAPYINITVLSDSYTTSKLLLVGSAAIIAALQLTFLVPRISTRFITNIPKRVKQACIFVVLGSAFSLIFSASFKTSLFGMFTAWESNLMIFICYALLFISWLAYFLVLKEYSLHKIVFHTLMTLALLVAAFYAIGEYYIWKPSTGYVSQSIVRISLGFRNPLFAAYFLGILWSYAAAKTLDGLTRELKTAFQKFASIGSYLTFVLISWALILTFTRSAWIAAGITFIVLLVIKAVQNKTVLGKLPIVTTILLLTLFMLGYSYRKEIGLRNTDLTIESQATLATIAQSIGKSETPEAALDFYQNSASYSSSDIRLLEWKWGIMTWTGSIKNFLIGVGPDAGFFEMPKYRDPIFNNFPTDSATKPFYVRSLYITFLMQFGIFVAIGTSLLVGFIFRKLSIRSDFSGIAIVIGFLTQGIFYYPTHIPTVLLLFGLAYLLAKYFPPEKISIRLTTLPEKMILSFIAVGIVVWLIPIAKAQYKISIYTQMVLPVPQSEMEKDSQLLLNNNILKRYLVYHYSDSKLAKQYLPILATSKDVDDLRIASDAYYLLARNNNSRPNTELSIEVTKRLLAIDSTLPATWDGLGLRYLYIRNFTEARTAFLKALELKEDYWYAYLHMGELSRQECHPKEALEWYKKAKQYVPSTDVEITEATGEITNPRAECK